LNFLDSVPITENTAYYANVMDGQSVVSSNVLNYKFIRPIYVGQMAASVPSQGSILAMDKYLVPKSTISHVFTFSQLRYCIAYPASYGPLDHIYDTNGFETIDDYTVFEINITCLDGAVVLYKVYLFNYLTEADNFTNTFRF